MNASLRALLSGVIDYAGLFPPAGLPLEQAIRNYAHYREGPDAWMLGRFVIPAARLPELDAFADLFQVRPPFSFSLLGRGGKDAIEFIEAVGADCKDAEEFARRFAGRVRADVCELRLPPEFNFRGVALIADMLGPTQWAVFFEASSPANQEEPLHQTLAKTAQIKERLEGVYPTASCGYKLRCGGLDASAFPTVEQVAFAIHSCREARVPTKLTAGLHHPLRHFDAALQTPMHGFINVFVAGVLAHARRVEEETLRAVIADEDAAHFTFTDGGLSWKDVLASVDEIIAARRDFVTSFGSCSFDEPRDDLRALGWM